MKNLATLAGRLGLSMSLILSGYATLGTGYAITQSRMEAMGVPSALLPLIILVEIIGGLATLTGVQTRWTAIGLAVFSVASAFIFQFDLGDQGQFISFMKSIAIGGGFLVLASHGAGRFSVDGWLENRRIAALFGTRSAIGGVL